MANTLFLRLEGPMQSWGERSRWSVRDTASEPTKSGIVGLLGCALGIQEDEPLRQLSLQLRMGVRCDRSGVLLRDYHTVVGGVLSAEGKVKINANTKEPETVVSERFYLCDASFLVAVQASDPDLIACLAQGVQAPRWPVFLGRKSCVPSLPIYAGVGTYADLQSALEDWPPGSPKEGTRTAVRGTLECAPGEGTRRRDAVFSRAQRTFEPRFTREVQLRVAEHKEGG
jgi:CRISPR system Cascade subunit CasD